MSDKKKAAPVTSREAMVFHFMLRWTSPHTTAALHNIKCFLKTIADKFVFQAEDTGDNAHYQGYFHTKDKKRPRSIAVAANRLLRGVEIQASSTAGREALAAYCMKPETRVAGPWGDKKIYMGADLWPEERFLPWQKEMLCFLRADPDDRTMYWVYDPIGNRGKTKFAKFLAYKEDAVLLGFANSGDALNLVSKMPGKQIYVWNLTRAKPAALSELDLYSAMESIKDGCFVNTKYETRQVLMDPPHVLVFANHLPKTAHISADRWNIMQINADTNQLESVREMLAPNHPFLPAEPADPFSLDDAADHDLWQAEELREQANRHAEELEESLADEEIAAQDPYSEWDLANMI